MNERNCSKGIFAKSLWYPESELPIDENFILNDSNETVGYLLPFAILTAFIPYLVIIPLILLFNVNLVTGPGHSFIFFYQCLQVAYVAGRSPVFKLILTFTPVLGFSGFIIQQFGSYMTIAAITRLATIFLMLLYLGLIWLLMKTKSCPLHFCLKHWARFHRVVRNFRERRSLHRSILTGTCSIFVLIYGEFVRSALELIIPRCLCTEQQTWYSPTNTTIEFQVKSYSNICSSDDIYNDFYRLSPSCFINSDESGLFCIDHIFQNLAWNQNSENVVGFLCLSVSLIPPIILVYYPHIHNLMTFLCRRVTGKTLPRLNKMNALFDTFQGDFKLKLPFFAGLYLFYIVMMYTLYTFPAYAVATNQNKDILLSASNYSILFGFLLILTMHALFQPYQNTMHNYIETLGLLLLITLSAISSIRFPEYWHKDGNKDTFNKTKSFNAFGMPIIFGCLTMLPAICVVIMFTWHCLKELKLQKGKFCRKTSDHEAVKFSELEEDTPVDVSYVSVSHGQNSYRLN